jgi:hypothetical protein
MGITLTIDELSRYVEKHNFKCFVFESDFQNKPQNDTSFNFRFDQLCVSKLTNAIMFKKDENKMILANIERIIIDDELMPMGVSITIEFKPNFNRNKNCSYIFFAKL